MLNLLINPLLIIFYNFVFIYLFVFFIYIKITKNLLAKYHQENKEILQRKAHERYQNLSKEEKDKNQQHGLEGYKQLSEDEKKILLSIEKNIIE